MTEVAQLRFHSDFWLNLHHTLYAAAWARRPEAGTRRANAGALPQPLDAPLDPDSRSAWDGAVDYYDRQLVERDLLFDPDMSRIKAALAAGDLDDEAVSAELKRVLEAAAPVYRRQFWPAHDRVNREWIAAAAERVRTIAPETIDRLERLYGTSWFAEPARVDVVWVGNRQGAYTTTRPPHVVISSGDGDLRGWMAAETVFHEVSHILVLPLQRELNRALGSEAREHGVLWHVIQFYLTGAAVQEVLRDRGIEHVPYLYATGLVDRAWPQYREVVEAHWQPYVEGRITRDEAIARTVRAVTRRAPTGSAVQAVPHSNR